MLSISNTTGSSLIAFSKDRINQVGTTVAGRCWNATRLLVRGGRRASTSKKANWPRAKRWWIKTASGEEWRVTHGFVEASAGRHGGKKAQQSRTTALDPRHVIQVLLEGSAFLGRIQNVSFGLFGFRRTWNICWKWSAGLKSLNYNKNSRKKTWNSVFGLIFLD